jgi:hypothetical protein
VFVNVSVCVNVGECISDREMWQNSVQGGILMCMEIPCYIVCR